VTGDRARAERARRDFPGARVVPDVAEVWAGARSHDLAVVATSTDTHVPLAAAAVEAGLAVVVEKPLAPSADPARRLVAQAQAAGTMLTVFHNRRWDAEHLTLHRLVDEGVLGDVTRYESRFERWRPDAEPGAWRHRLSPDEGGGVLLDLGVHLIDQARTLLGPVARVYGEVAARRGGADDDVFLALDHQAGGHSHLWASALSPAPGPRLRVLGRSAAFVVEHLDGQEDELRVGRRPGEPGFGAVPPSRWGRLLHGDEGVPVPSEPGRWAAFYEAVVAALRDGAPPPVDPRDAVAGLEVVDAARRSAAQGIVVALSPT